MFFSPPSAVGWYSPSRDSRESSTDDIKRFSRKKPLGRCFRVAPVTLLVRINTRRSRVIPERPVACRRSAAVRHKRATRPLVVVDARRFRYYYSRVVSVENVSARKSRTRRLKSRAHVCLRAAFRIDVETRVVRKRRKRRKAMQNTNVTRGDEQSTGVEYNNIVSQ